LSRNSVTDSEHEFKLESGRMPDVLEHREQQHKEHKSLVAPPSIPANIPPQVPARKEVLPEVVVRKELVVEKQDSRPEVPERKLLARTEEPRVTPPQVPERPHKVLERTREKGEEGRPVTVLHRGILHIRSQLRKQSSSNSASALPSVAYGGSTSSIPSALMICSSSPRWIRQNAVFYSNNNLEILNPVSRSCSVSSSSGILSSNPKSNSFKVKISKANAKPNHNEFAVMTATEVHSRPFAFKISNPDTITYYLAAESQVELDAWLSVLSTGVTLGGGSKSLHDRTMLQRALGGLSSTADSGRRNFARAPYKRSISLGSQSPNVSSTNLSCQNAIGTPPPAPPNPGTPARYGSSTSLHVKGTVRAANPETSPTRLLNRSKSSSLKTDWFLRNSSSNISSITITSKKITKSQVTQYPTPNSTPTKQQTSMPMMGVAMKTKKNSSSTGGSSSSSPTRKYMCPNCCNVTKVDMSTQTDNGSNVKVVFFNEESRV